MEVTVHDSVEPQDPHDWSVEKVDTFVRSLEPNSVIDGDSVSKKTQHNVEIHTRCGSPSIQR